MINEYTYECNNCAPPDKCILVMIEHTVTNVSPKFTPKPYCCPISGKANWKLKNKK